MNISEILKLSRAKMNIAEAYPLQKYRIFWDYNMLGDKIYFEIQKLKGDEYKVIISGADKRVFIEKGTVEFRSLWNRRLN